MYPDVKTQVLGASPLPPIFRFQLCVYPDGCQAGEHTNICHHSIVPMEGCALFQERGGQELRCLPGTILVIPEKIVYKWRMEGKTTLFQCLHHPFNFVEHRALANLFGRTQRHMALITLPEREFPSFKARLEEDMHGAEEGVGLTLSADMLRIMASASACATSSSGRMHGHPAIAKAISFMEANIAREITLKELSSETELASSRLSQLFRNYTGKSPMQYAAMLKAERATTLLLADGLRVCEVADKLGFASESYFRRFYKHQTGQTPGALSRRCGRLEKSPNQC